MPHKLNPAIAVIGIDIGKNSFHVVGHSFRELTIGGVFDGMTARRRS